jgi:hypothetical protein
MHVLLLAGGVAAGAGCVSVKAPERINFQPHAEVADPSQVPPTYSHEEAREKLAEAYAEIRYLRDKVSDLEEDKDELKRERDHYKRRADD